MVRKPHPGGKLRLYSSCDATLICIKGMREQRIGARAKAKARTRQLPDPELSHVPPETAAG